MSKYYELLVDGGLIADLYVIYFFSNKILNLCQLKFIVHIFYLS